MRYLLFGLLMQVLTAPDPMQMEKAPALPYRPVPHTFTLPEGSTWGAPSSVATSAKGHTVVFNRGPNPLLEFDREGRFVRAFGAGRYERPHGMRLDRDDNIWTTDVAGHTVTKMNWQGDVLLTLGTKGQAGDWNESAGARLFSEPNDLAIAANGDVFVVQGHGKGDPKVLKFTSSGQFVRSWGGKGTGPGQFDIAHSIVIDASQQVYVADRQNRRVQIFNTDGKFVREWKLPGCHADCSSDRDSGCSSRAGSPGRF